MTCGEKEAASWTAVVLVGCSEVVMVETEGASLVARAWTKVALVEEDGEPLWAPWTLMEQMGGRGGCGGPGKMDKGKHHQECRDQPY